MQRYILVLVVFIFGCSAMDKKEIYLESFLSGLKSPVKNVIKENGITTVIVREIEEDSNSMALVDFEPTAGIGSSHIPVIREYETGLRQYCDVKYIFSTTDKLIKKELLVESCSMSAK
ncbi:MAG: hypothetical protein K6L73_13835 [Cellvibrionaceae bacterium]